MSVVFTPTPTNETNATEFDDGDAPSAAIINPLGEAAFNTAKWAANRVGAFRLIQIEDSAAASSGGSLGSTTAATWGTGDVFLSTVEVDEQDVVEISVDVHAGCVPAAECAFRLAYTLEGGAVTAITGAQANRVDTVSMQTPIHMQGCLHVGALGSGTLNIYLQMQVTGGAILVAVPPLSPVVKVWRFNS